MTDTRIIGITFSMHFGIETPWMASKGIFNPTLDVDSPLFIDPFLLSYSRHKEFGDEAATAYEEHFSEIHRLLSASEGKGDKAWKAALKRFQFSEARGMGGTCLGYSTRGGHGRAFGPILSARALDWASSVIRLGVKDPELFSCLSLFENGVGADLISDMVCNICIKQIIDFNKRIYKLISEEAGVTCPLEPFTLAGCSAMLPRNPFSNDPVPIILLPADVLKHLPLADNPGDLARVAAQNSDLRDRVNTNIGEIFKIRAKKDKDAIAHRAMRDAAAFQTFLDLLKILEKQPYDVYKDPEGLLQWSHAAHDYAALNPIKVLDDPSLPEIDRIDSVCRAIIDQFQHLVEQKRMWRVFHVDGKPRHERFAQLLFYAVAASYCDANNLDIAPETDGGAGPIDFKLSRGTKRVVIEIKLSTNQKLVNGYKKQLDAYIEAERADRGHYIVIDVGSMGEKWDRLREVARASAKFREIKQVHLIDGNVKLSASKL